MTDKQIIIDNIDVSGCEYYFDNKCRCMDASIMQDFYSCPQCNNNPNCYYKQFKRKEQECKILREEKAYTDMACEQFENQLKAKGQECERLKIEVKQIGTAFIDKGDLLNNALDKINQLKAENNELKKNDCEQCKHLELYMKLKQTLAKIKEIVEDQKDVLESMRIDIAEQILQKISEVENVSSDSQ